MNNLAGKTLYLDSNIFIYFVEGIEQWERPAKYVIKLIDEGQCAGVVSELALAECLVKPKLDDRPDVIATYLRMMGPGTNLFSAPISREILIEAADLRAKHKMRLPDAIHMATARLANCAVFITNDTRIQGSIGMPVVTLTEILAGMA
jgi:predicted nucleic acid-binding protein